MLRRLARLWIRNLPELALRDHGGLMRMKVPFAEDVGTANLDQRVDRQFLGIFLHLRPQRQGCEDGVGGLHIGPRVLIRCAHFPTRSEQRWPQAVLLPLLEVLLDVLVVVPDAQLVNAVSADALQVLIGQLPTRVEVHVLPIPEAHHTKLCALQGLRLCLVLEPFEELHRIVCGIALAISGNHYDHHFVLDKLVGIEFLEICDSRLQPMLLRLLFQLVREALSGAALGAKVDANDIFDIGRNSLFVLLLVDLASIRRLQRLRLRREETPPQKAQSGRAKHDAGRKLYKLADLIPHLPRLVLR
mmetsp:Transcript_63209/g.181795  ORF Transcript_63209/g.181795 Transcript_63209/m.181795 type:complete len:302 (-) Transcript_63209:8-913(-)